MAGETDIEYGGAYGMVFDYVHHMGIEFAGLPCERAARLKDNPEMRVMGVEVVEYCDEMLHVVVLARHEMPAAKIEPACLAKRVIKLCGQVTECVFKRMAVALAVAVAVYALNSIGKFSAQLPRCDSEA